MDRPIDGTTEALLRKVGLTAASLCLAFLLFWPVANARADSTAWTVTSEARPAVFPSENPVGCPATFQFCARYQIVAQNRGSAATGPVTLRDSLPAGITPVAVERSETLECVTAVECTAEGSVPGQVFVMVVFVDIGPLVGVEATNAAEAEVGGEAVARSSSTNLVGSVPSSFGPNRATFEIYGPSGEPATQAGAHPYAVTSSIFAKTKLVSETNEAPSVESVKNIVVDLPNGLVGNPSAFPQCPQSALRKGGEESNCPVGSQVGVLAFSSANKRLSLGEQNLSFPIFNMVPERGYPAEFGFTYSNQPITLYVTSHHLAGHGNQFGLQVISPGLPRAVQIAFVGALVTFWGEPGDGSHNGQRLFQGSEARGAQFSGTRAAFLTNPSQCRTSPLDATFSMDSWLKPDLMQSLSTPAYSSIEGCEQLQFHPTLSVSAESGQADSPTGLEVAVKVPQALERSPNLATPPLEDATVRLPLGMTASPAAAEGLVGCAATGAAGIGLDAEEVGAGHPGGNGSPYDDGLLHTEPGHCPDGSILGTAEVFTPLLSAPLKGHIFLGSPECGPCSDGDAQGGKLLKLYLEVSGSGVIVKLAGSASVDPTTGQITTSFDEDPQLPLEELKVRLDGGPRAPLVNSAICGSYRTTSAFSAWSAPATPEANPSDSFDIGSGPGGTRCVSSEAEEPNHPHLQSGSVSPIAGAYSPFVLRLSREDGTQRIRSIDTTLPAGLLGKLAGIPYCSDAALSAVGARAGTAERSSSSCPAASEVGTVDVGAGAGSQPLHVQGHAYLAGPYRGAPLSLAIITPAVAGPFDLGTVVVRTALYVNETTAQINAVSDPLPSILAGIPLDIRSVALNMNKPNFTLNPTSCNPMQVLGSATSTLGNVAPLQNRFQVGACNALGFKPSIALSLKGGTKRHSFPALKATVTYPKQGSYANIRKAQVTLPHSEFLEQGHIGTVCTRVQFAAKACPKASIYGKAMAISPLLDHPVSGPVYLRSSSNKLPDLVAELNGQIDVALDGKIDTGKGGGIRNTFQAVPDAPVSKFVLELKGGKKGLLVNSENICSKPQHATADFTGQNGKVYDTEPLIANSCGKKSKGKKKASKRVGTSHR